MANLTPNGWDTEDIVGGEAARWGRDSTGALGLINPDSESLIYQSAITNKYDVVVYGATPSGITAAVSAKRMGKSVVLIDPEDKIGGTMGGGLSWADIKPSANRLCLPGLSNEIYSRAARYYGKSPQEFYQSNCHATPRVNRTILSALLTENNIHVVLNSPVKNVDKLGTKIIKAAFGDMQFWGGVFIDCSYEQDLMAVSGITYVVGRESSGKYGESNAGVRTPSTTIIPAGVDPYITPGNAASGIIPGVSSEPVQPAGSADGKVQAFTYRLCMKNAATNRIPFPAPSKYNALDYELCARLFAVTAPTSITDILTIQLLAETNKYDANNNGGFSINYVSPENAEYISASWARRREIRENVKQHILGWWYFLNNDARVPGALKTSISAWGLSSEEFVANAGFSDVLYVRESRRMVGDYVFTQADLSLTATLADEIAFGFYDSDSHTVQRVIVGGEVRAEGNVFTSVTAGYRIPYRVLLPKASECTNLLSTFGASMSRVAFLSVRMESKLMVLGQAAGIAAAIAVDDGVSVQDVPYSKLVRFHDPFGVFTKNRAIVLNTSGEYANGTVVQAGGSWTTSSSTFGFIGASALNDQNTGKGKTLTFNPNIPETGMYLVYFQYPSNTIATRANNAPVTINHAAGATSLTLDMSYANGLGGSWEDLGAYVFRKGAPSVDNVVIGTTGTTQTVVASAIKFVKLEA